MIDTKFVQDTFKKGELAMSKVKAEFSVLSPSQLNWKPAPERWSVGECLEHLILSNSPYFPVFEQIRAGTYEMPAWARWSPFSGLFGRLLVSMTEETAKRKVKAPKISRPSASEIDAGIVGHFETHQEKLLGYVESFENVDLDTTFVVSPLAKIATYSLRDALTILVQHEHRHINQAIRVTQGENFPN